MNEKELSVYVLQLLRKKRVSQKDFCLDNNISYTCLNRVISCKAPPTPKVLEAIGVKKVTTYEVQQ